MLPPFHDVSLAEVFDWLQWCFSSPGWHTDASSSWYQRHPATRVYSRSTTGQPVEFGWCKWCNCALICCRPLALARQILCLSDNEGIDDRGDTWIHDPPKVTTGRHRKHKLCTSGWHNNIFRLVHEKQTGVGTVHQRILKRHVPIDSWHIVGGFLIPITLCHGEPPPGCKCCAHSAPARVAFGKCRGSGSLRTGDPQGTGIPSDFLCVFEFL